VAAVFQENNDDETNTSSFVRGDNFESVSTVILSWISIEAIHTGCSLACNDGNTSVWKERRNLPQGGKLDRNFVIPGIVCF
jgi:hypothetical protein